MCGRRWFNALKWISDYRRICYDAGGYYVIAWLLLSSTPRSYYKLGWNIVGRKFTSEGRYSFRLFSCTSSSSFNDPSRTIIIDSEMSFSMSAKVRDKVNIARIKLLLHELFVDLAVY